MPQALAGLGGPRLQAAGLLVAWACCSASAAAEGHEAKHEESAGDPNTSISIMLFGAIAFMMCLFYLTHVNDPDFKFYMWRTVSATITIFVAVILFQAVNGVLIAYLLSEEEEEHPTPWALAVSMTHLLFWHISLQFVLGWTSGGIEVPWQRLLTRKEAAHEGLQEPLAIRTGEELSAEERIKDAEEEEQAEVMMKYRALLLGHITGFAAINALGVAQQMLGSAEGLLEERAFSFRLLAALLVVPVSWGCLNVFYNITDRVRTRTAEADDGIEDDLEKMWDEETEETEDDIIGLAMSFLLVQVVRAANCGVLPNLEGELEEMDLSPLGAFRIFALGLICLVVVVLVVKKIKGGEDEQPRFARQLENIGSMSFAWCTFFVLKWAVNGMFEFEEEIMNDIVLAQCVSAVSILGIYLGDMVADSEATSPEVDEVIRGHMIYAFGFLIGFAWEKTFDRGVVVIAEHSGHEEHTTKLVLAGLLSMLVVPAWKCYILPYTMELMRHEKTRREQEKLTSPKPLSRRTTAVLGAVLSDMKTTLGKDLKAAHRDRHSGDGDDEETTEVERNLAAAKTLEEELQERLNHLRLHVTYKKALTARNKQLMQHAELLQEEFSHLHSATQMLLAERATNARDALGL